MTDEPTAIPAPEPQPAEPTAPEPEVAPPTGPSAGEAWSEVVARMAELSSAIATWTRTAADNPDNRRRLDDVRNGVNDMARQADAAFTRVTGTDFGQQVKSGAEDAGQAIGDAAQSFSDAAAPHVATAFAGLASMFGTAAQKVEEAASRQRAAAEAAPEPAAPVAPEPAPAPAPEPPVATPPATETPEG